MRKLAMLSGSTKPSAPQPPLAPAIQKIVAGPTPGPLPPRYEGFGGQAQGGERPTGTSRTAAPRRSTKRLLWVSLIIMDLAVLVWVVPFVVRKRWQEVQASPPPTAAVSRAAVGAAPAPAATYRDSHGRFACTIPGGWTVIEDRGDSRSKVRFVSGGDEIRVIAQEAESAKLEEADRQAVSQSVGDLLDRARASGIEGRLVRTEWRPFGGGRALQIEIEMRPPGYLWMRQLKFRAQGLDHTVALCIAAPERRAVLLHVFDRFLETYQALPQPPKPAVAAARLTPPPP